MVLGWRKAFCTSRPSPKDQEIDVSDTRPIPGSKSGGSSSTPSTPRLQSTGLRCRIKTTSSNSLPHSPKTTSLFHRSAPSSPRSPSTFSLLKSTLRISKNRCGICSQSTKTGQSTAIFTAECGHSFHFPCISTAVRKQLSLACPVCSFVWKDNDQSLKLLPQNGESNSKRCVLKVYNDDEPLSSPTSGARFNPIPESDETDEEIEEFPGFLTAVNEVKMKNLEISLLPETAAVSVTKTSETYAVVLKIKAPEARIGHGGVPIDLVIVLDVSRSLTTDKLQLMRKIMRTVVSSLTAADRFSIVAFSTTSKRLMPLRRMTTAGRRSAHRIIDAVVSLDGGATCAADAIKKAAKVIEDRREKNPGAKILFLSDGRRTGSIVSSTRFSESQIALHSLNLSACINAPPDDIFGNYISGLLTDPVQDVRIQVGLTSDSDPAEISAMYSYTGRAAYLGSGSSWCRVGHFYSKEEREVLIELKVPSSAPLDRVHRHLTIRCSYKDALSQKTTYDNERIITIPSLRTIGSSQKLRCLFITTRAIAMSRRLVDKNDVTNAHRMLASARALMLQLSSNYNLGLEFVRTLEAEMAEVKRHDDARLRVEERVEPLTPTSAWRAAERLAKLAVLRKSLNRVSDLHGFEDARF